MLALFSSLPALAATVSVGDVPALREAVADAQPGDTIFLAAGVHRLSSALDLAAAGTRTAPIVLTGARDGTTTIEVDTVEGLRVMGPHWTIERLDIVGVCSADDTCEHAIHASGDADGLRVEGCSLRDFNAQLKSNGLDGRFPDDVVIRGNRFSNRAPRQTARPVVPIDVVGGDRWQVVANDIRDFAKAGGNQISYAAFLKGNGQDGRFERNLIVCEDTHRGHVRLGLSLGGGGTSPDSVCQGGDCSVEHTGGVIENNIIVDCPEDVGIYLNAAQDTQVRFNLLWNTTGIDARFAETNATLTGNVSDGRVRERDGGVAVLGDDWLETDAIPAVYADPAAGRFHVTDADALAASDTDVPELDFCGVLRTDPAVIGPVAVGSTCDTWTTHPADAETGDDTGESADSGLEGDDPHADADGPSGTDPANAADRGSRRSGPAACSSSAGRAALPFALLFPTLCVLVARIRRS